MIPNQDNLDQNDAEPEFKVIKITMDQDYEAWRRETLAVLTAVQRRCEEYRREHRREMATHYGSFVTGRGWTVDHQCTCRFVPRDWHIREAARLSSELRALLNMTPEEFAEQWHRKHGKQES
ncbi:hypothetical protein MRB56_14175 [Halomonas cupida]|uniref:hypothetical protein n=1 Tax=Halomonas cupida TaxID=44933 RepID=UPI0039B4007C